jgi:hypothetical protein
MNRPAPYTSAALLALLAACATPRKDFGEITIKTDQPIVSAQRYDYVNFRVEAGRLLVGAPYSGTDFDLVVMEDGCLRGSSGDTQLYYCPTSPEPDEHGVRHWRGVGGGTAFFSTILREGGKFLEIESAMFRAEIELGSSPTDDEIRRHPELLGAAFSRGLFPASKDDPNSDASHREWKYVLSRK